MWRLLIGCLSMGRIAWAQNSDELSSHSLSPVSPTSCKDVESNSVRLVKATLNNGVQVLCDTQTDNGGWIIIQRRYDSTQSFYLGWNDYVNGFGKLDNNFWMGLRLINELTYKRCYELRIDMTYKDTPYYAQYSHFKVNGPEDNYRLKVGNYSGNAGDALVAHDGQQFTTKDRDNDLYQNHNCARRYPSGWWHRTCHWANLNGVWNAKEFGIGLNWKPLTGYYDSVTLSEMKIRPCP